MCDSCRATQVMMGHVLVHYILSPVSSGITFIRDGTTVQHLCPALLVIKNSGSSGTLQPVLTFTASNPAVWSVAVLF